MYYEYWNLKKPPFDNVPDPTMYAECHTSMENAIAESLFAIEEGGECIAVIVGDVGLGKTLSLRIIIDSLDHEKYKIALITNPSTTFVQILREIIGQITGVQCEEKKKVDLLEIFNRILFETIDEGKKVLIFIDEANAISPSNLENLRLLTNMQDDQRNLFTMVLAGQTELARRLEHPKRANLFQRIGTYNRLEKIQSEELVKEYVETRLRHAGGGRNIFTDDAHPVIYEYSEYGIPRLINKICKLSLKAGETNEFDSINGEIVRHIGERFKKTTGFASPKRMPRKRPKDGKGLEIIESPEDTLEETLEERSNVGNDAVIEQINSIKSPILLNSEECNTINTIKNAKIKDEKSITEKIKATETHDLDVELSMNDDGDTTEAEIRDCKVRLYFPSQLLRQAQSSSVEHRMKLAGVMAAKTLKENPQLTKALTNDPVSIWGEIRDLVLSKMG